MRVEQFLSQQRVAFETIVHPPAFTAQKRAKYLGIPGQLVAKCVLLHGPSGYLLAVLPATYRVDLEALTHALNGPVRLASGRELTEVFQDCEWGVAAPISS